MIEITDLEFKEKIKQMIREVYEELQKDKLFNINSNSNIPNPCEHCPNNKPNAVCCCSLPNRIYV